MQIGEQNSYQKPQKKGIKKKQIKEVFGQKNWQKVVKPNPNLWV